MSPMVTNGDNGTISANDDPFETMMIHWSYNGDNGSNGDNCSNGDNGTNNFNDDSGNIGAPVRNLWEDTKILPTQIMAEKLE